MSLSVLKAWARDYRRALALALGVVMAVALFSALNINIDASSVKLLDAIMSNLPADALVYRIGGLEGGPEGGWPALADMIEDVEGVREVEMCISLAFHANPNTYVEVNGQLLDLRGATDNYTRPLLVCSLSEGLLPKAGIELVEGSWNLTGHGVVLSTALAGELGVEVGDKIALVMKVPVQGGEIELRSPEFEVRGLVRAGGDAMRYLMPYKSQELVRARAPLLLCLDYGALEETVAAFSARKPKLIFLYYVWIDRDEVIDPWNLDATEDRVHEIEVEIGVLAEEYGATVLMYISYAIRGLRAALNGIRFVTGALSFPVFLLCWYLVMTAGYLISGAKRREIGLLRVRGVSSRSVFAVYMLTAIAVGVLGSVAGALMGMGIAQAYFSLAGEELPEKALLGPMRPYMLGLEIGLGTAVCVVASVKPARMASRLAPIEATKEYVEAEAVEEWRPGKLVLVLFALGTVKMVEWALGIDTLELLQAARGLPFFIAVAFYIYVMFDNFVLNFFGPIFFIYGSTCLLVRSSRRLYRLASFLAKPLGPVRELVSRSLSRNPVRASRVAFLISIAIAFGSVMSLLAASVMDAQVRTARVVVGSDMRVEVYEGVGPDFADQLAGVEGVREVATVLYGPSVVVRPIGQALLYAIDPSEFADVAYMEEGFCEPEMWDALSELVEDEHKILVSRAIAEDHDIGVGSELILSPPGWIEGGPVVRVEVAGVVNVFPGSLTSPFARDYFVILNEGLLDELGLTDLVPYFLVDVEGRDVGEVASAVESAFPDEVLDVETVDDVLSRSSYIMVGQAIYTYLRQSFVCSLAVAASGLTLTAVVGVRERTYEMGLLRARGMRRKQVILALAYEYLIVSIIGLAIGAATGLITVLGLTSMMSDFWPIKVRVLFPLDFWAFMGSGVTLFMASSALPAALAFRKTVVETIRFR